jgi:replication-associated recombination protein RarA
VEQQYLPDKLSGRRYYVPIRGLESQMAARLEERRRAAGPEPGHEEEVSES